MYIFILYIKEKWRYFLFTMYWPKLKMCENRSRWLNLPFGHHLDQIANWRKIISAFNESMPSEGEKNGQNESEKTSAIALDRQSAEILFSPLSHTPLIAIRNNKTEFIFVAENGVYGAQDWGH